MCSLPTTAASSPLTLPPPLLLPPPHAAASSASGTSTRIARRLMSRRRVAAASRLVDGCIGHFGRLHVLAAERLGQELPADVFADVRLGHPGLPELLAIPGLVAAERALLELAQPGVDRGRVDRDVRRFGL